MEENELEIPLGNHRKRIMEYMKLAWIPVSEKKPEDGADCLCYDGTYDYVFIGWFEKGKFYKLDDDGGGSDIPYKIKTVTHWQPLPPPPDEEE